MRNLQVITSSSAPRAWTVGDLGAFYTEHRSELHAHASRVLKDSVKAEEITQEALIKFMLAAPELESAEHALAYLHRTIENLCIDLFRAEGRRPNLVVIDDATAEVEAAWQNNGDHSAAMSAAEVASAFASRTAGAVIAAGTVVTNGTIGGTVGAFTSGAAGGAGQPRPGRTLPRARAQPRARRARGDAGADARRMGLALAAARVGSRVGGGRREAGPAERVRRPAQVHDAHHQAPRDAGGAARAA